MKLPNTLISSLIERARENPGCVILPEGDDSRVQEAARIILDWGVMKSVTLITTTGSADSTHANSRVRNVSHKDPTQIQKAIKVVTENLERRRKPVDLDSINRVAANPLYQAGACLSLGEADCVVAGCVATTADVIRAAIGTIGLAPGINTVSGSFIMNRERDGRDETFIFADCGVVIEPTLNQLVDIASGSADTFKKITREDPVVAFLSFSTKGSAEHPAAIKMRDAASRFQELHPGIASDGELQFDAAYVASVGIRKAPGSAVPGKANCFVFPDLGAGNIAYKITQRLGDFGAYGPILQGLAKPYSDLSRGASAEDIAISCLINLLRAR
jgi:phosphate acetyltransferase